nr:immunoglobulin heavy chain junction region [Macaca mulatta]
CTRYVYGSGFDYW